MGGNAIPNAQRMSKERYLEVCDDLSQTFKYVSKSSQVTGWANGDFYIVPAYEDKDSFGDIDIVIGITKEFDRKQFEKYVIGACFKVTNGPVTSFEWEGHQVDLIYHSMKDYYFACNYYSYNDISNLIGRITHKMGFKFGHDGLWYIMRDGDYVIQDICITKDFKTALSLFDFDYERFSKGFKNLEEIFEYIVSNPYFNPDIYLLENRNHTARVRDRKRKTYMAFLDYCANNDFKNKYTFQEDKEIYLDMMCSKFPRFRAELALAKNINNTRKMAKSKLTTEIIKEHTGLKDKELGDYIKATVQRYNNTYDWWVIINSLTVDQILELMDFNYKETKQ